MSQSRVAILGLGIMGSGMAGRVLGGGFPLVVYNRNSAKTAPLVSKGAKMAATPKEAASQADIVISVVSDDEASRGIWLGENGALAGAAPGSILIESSTLTVGWIQQLAQSAAQKKCEFLDAPVTGSKPHAANGELFFLIGGSAAAVEKAKPILEVMSRGMLHLGANGSGARMKLINNFVCGVQAAALAEAASLIQKGGLDVTKAFSVLTNGAPGSPLVKTLSERVASGSTDVNFELRLMAKDLGYAMDEASRNHMTLETAAAARGIFGRAIDKGFGDKDMSAVITATRAAGAH
jgi:3-hydroxyisobutyrate dehydrogenase